MRPRIRAARARQAGGPVASWRLPLLLTTSVCQHRCPLVTWVLSTRAYDLRPVPPQADPERHRRLWLSGVEGLYRRVCEITLDVLRAHRGSILRWAPATARPRILEHQCRPRLIHNPPPARWQSARILVKWRPMTSRPLLSPFGACSHIDTFVHDPLVEWVRSGSNSGNGNGNGGSKSAAANDEGGDNPHAKDALATIEGAWVVMCCPGALAVISHTAATVFWAVCARSTATKSVDVAPRLPLHTSK